MPSLNRAYVLAAFALLFIPYVVFNAVVATATSERSKYLYVFGSEKCPACAYFKKWLAENYDGVWYFCDLSDQDCARRFSQLVGMMGFPVALIPTTVVVNETVRAIVIGSVADVSFWKHMMDMPTEGGIPVFRGDSMITSIDNPTAREVIMEEIVSTQPPSITTTANTTQKPSERSEANYYYLAVSLAALDSINLCVFPLLTTLLITSYLVGGVGKATAVGASFTVGVFLSYFTLGVFLFRLTAFIPRAVMSAVAVVFGVLAMADILNKDVISRATARPELWSGVLGLTASITLLPCTAGPYIFFPRVMADLPTAEATGFILLYDAVFTMPLLCMAFIGFSILKQEKVVAKAGKYEKILRIIGGAALVFLGIMLLIR